MVPRFLCDCVRIETAPHNGKLFAINIFVCPVGDKIGASLNAVVRQAYRRVFFTHAIFSTTLVKAATGTMSFYDEIEIEDMTYHESTTLYTYPCPCGDQFEISLSDLRDGEEVAVCPSCSLMIKVIFEVVRSV